MELGESLDETAKRELFEETGLIANSLELFGVFSGADMHYTYQNGDEVSIVDIVYVCRDYSGELKANSNEVDELRFFALDELPDNISPPQVKPLAVYAHRKKLVRAKAILANWDIPQDLPITHLANSVWSVGEDYILKSGRREWLLRSVQLTKALAEQGFAVGEPIPTESGADFADGDPVWILYRVVKGEPLAMSERFGDRRGEYAFKFGAAIAKLHNALAKISADVAVDDVDLFQHVTEWAMLKANVSEELSREYIGEFKELCARLPRQLIHRDTHPENIIWRDGEVSGFIDFDIAQRNVRLWDICYCSTALLPDCPSDEREKWFEVLRGLLLGYNSVTPLTDAEKQAVFYVICSIQFVFIAWGSDDAEMTKMNREMLAFITQNKERIRTII
jgi:Ser/Thr protein kinase RdoA (MazF antagonist)/ADP-ribose pyrophosphatase YjhB (NUDIX family)